MADENCSEISSKMILLCALIGLKLLNYLKCNSEVELIKQTFKIKRLMFNHLFRSLDVSI